MVVEFVDEFADKVFAFVCGAFLVQGTCAHGPEPTFAAFFSTRHCLIVFVEQSFSFTIPAGVIFFFAFGSRQVVCRANVNGNCVCWFNFRSVDVTLIMLANTIP